MYYRQMYTSILGEMIIVANEDSIIGLWFDKQKNLYYNLPQDILIIDKVNKVIENTIKWLNDYYSGLNPNPNLIKIEPLGTRFQQDVWHLLQEIPYGTVCTYKDIAIKIASKYSVRTMSAQAVGNAISHNPISIIIPCHRVIGSNHTLTGYAGGIEKKRRLIEIEKAI